MTSIKKIFQELIMPAAMLAALTIGAGFFALPYLFYKSGALIGFGYLVVFSIIISIIHLMYGEIIDATEEDHRFVGYVQIYLGRLGSYISFITTFLGIILTLLIYLVLIVQLSHSFFNFQNNLIPAGIFLVLTTLPLFWGIRKVADLGFLITLGKVILIVLIFIFGLNSFLDLPTSFFTQLDLSKIFLPYSAILFSLYGRSAISTVKEYFRANKLEKDNSDAKFKLAILAGTIIPTVLYSLFIIGVLGISHANVTEDAVSGLQSTPILWIAGGILGITSIWAAYVFLQFELNGILVEDFKFKPSAAHIFSISVPAILYLLGLNNLLGLISISGGVFIALESIMVILMWNKVEKMRYPNKKRTLSLGFSSILILIFALGGLYSIFS